MSGAVGKALDDTTSAAAAHDARVREEGRRAGIEEAARVAEGRPYKGRYRTWPWWTNPDGSQGNRANESDLVQHADKTAAAIRALAAAPATPPPFDLVAHLHRQRAFSERTFGPGQRTKGVVDHIRKELSEIEADPADVMEWVDVIILGFDGAWRAGWTPEAIVVAMVEKQTRNEARSWPDWRNVDPDRAIEHDRTAENGCRNG
ncbi:MAG: DUF550 domain-containing protein [Phenylobacterium sp.]|nr:DUF550 domain-containing protein [Phenylobacterium sp.]